MNELVPLILLIISGLAIRFSLIYTGQYWAKSHAQTVTFLILPIITYVITKTISGNIALSLGMIGALSIVRFRHPVKSALELVIYFDLITLGIATSVRTKWAIQLVVCTIFVLLLVKFSQKIFKAFGFSFYSASFDEGNLNNTLEIISKKRNIELEKNVNLINLFEDIDANKYIYRLRFNNKNHLMEFKETVSEIENIEKINTIVN